MDVTILAGDITAQRVDAIVNAANSSLLGGGGVDGAIHRKGGPQILAECRKLRASHYGRGLGVGRAVATTAGKLDARWVIHTVGPVYSAEQDRTEQLRSCYRNSLAVAVELGATSVAFPLVSAGLYGWPLEAAIQTALEVLESTPAPPSQARLVLFNREAQAAARRLRPDLTQDGGPAR
ncbi:MAG: O-acetyl-ADP-ribose deacetylase [Stackebrandtia sp.]